MLREFKVGSIEVRQPPESPFIKGDLTEFFLEKWDLKIPLNKGGKGVVFVEYLLHIKKVATYGSLI